MLQQRLDSFTDLMTDSLLSVHGGRKRLRFLSDEDLHRARLAILREQVTMADCADDAHPLRVITYAIALGHALHAVEGEEQARTRAWESAGVPRDEPGEWVPEDVVEAIKARLSPVELFHRWGLTDLREVRSGKWLGKCPFHEDGTPSLYVYTDDPRDMHWHCFGCAAHGDVFDLARLHTGRDFRECCEGLASAAGVNWPPPPPAPPPPPSVTRFGDLAARIADGR